MDTAGSLISTVFLPALAIWICCIRFICKANVIDLFESTKNIFFRRSNWLVDSLIFFVLLAGLEPARPFGSLDLKSSASTNFTTGVVVPIVGLEPTHPEVLIPKTSASTIPPYGHSAEKTGFEPMIPFGMPR